MPHNPYTGVHNPSPYSPEALLVPTGWRTPADQNHETHCVDPDAAEADGRTIHLEQITTQVLHDTSVTTTGVLHGELVRPTAWTDEDFTQATGIYMGETVTVPLPSGHRVEEVTLEVPVSHGKLTYALGAVDATIAGRRAFGYTIPEESRTVTTIGNEIVIRWEEHS